MVLGSKAIDDILKQEVLDSLNDISYPVNKWYGITFMLDIFKDSDLGVLISGSENKPVFRSSPYCYGGAYTDAQFNWLLLENIKESYPIRYDAVLDLDSPVFIDIYGNIVTESGLVVIPYAANSTLHNRISLLNAAFLSSYGKTKFITRNEDTNSAYIGNTYINFDTQCLNLITDYPAFIDTKVHEILIADEKNNCFLINPITITTGIGSIDLAKLDVTSIASNTVLYNLALSLYTEHISDNSFISSEAFINIENDISNVLYQVLRGANLDKINYEEEKLNEGINYDKAVLSQALKYERLIEQMFSISENSLITVPDLTTMPGIKYAVFFLYKILIILFTVYVLFQVYLSASSQQLNISTISKIVVAFLCIGVTIFSLPLIYKYSYYTVTRTLLQDEAMTISMLNEEKRNNNVELGILQAKNPDIHSKLTLKIQDIEIDYASYISAIINTFDIKEMQDIYEREINYSLESDEYDLKGHSLYYDIDNLFASSQIYVDTSSNKLKQVVSGEPAISFRLPYYVILDYLIENINQYNDILNSYNYGVQIMGDGKIRSIGLTERYFKSNAFNVTRKDLIENIEMFSDLDENVKAFAMYDKTGVFAIYNYKGYDNRTFFIDRNPIINSQWYVDAIAGDSDKVVEMSEMLDKEAILWIKKHENIIGRISDETLLKALALHLSLKYNEILNVPGPQKIEIESISTEDIIRLCIADSNLVLTTSPYSYPKFILLTSGLPGIYIGAVITLITFILSLVKPTVTLLSFLIMIASLVILRILFNKKTENLKGFIKFIIILIVVNISYAGNLKLFMLLPSNIPCLIRLILFLIVQMFYTATYIWIASVLVFNWQDMGNMAFGNVVALHTLSIKKISDKDNITENNNDSEEKWNIYNRLKSEDKYRKNYKKSDKE